MSKEVIRRRYERALKRFRKYGSDVAESAVIRFGAMLEVMV